MSRTRLGLYSDITLANAETAPRVDLAGAGAWVLRSHKPKQFFGVGDKRYELPIFHIAPDMGVVSLLVNISFGNSILDLGAGVGQYGRHVRHRNPFAVYSAFDGAKGVRNFSSGFVRHLQLNTFQPALPTMDWVVSLEVGEHIPYEFERNYVNNLHAHNRKGIVLSWASLGQFGHGHVNNHSPAYILRLFKLKGYTLDETTTSTVRRLASYPWFRQNTYVFRRSNRV